MVSIDTIITASLLRLVSFVFLFVG